MTIGIVMVIITVVVAVGVAAVVVCVHGRFKVLMYRQQAAMTWPVAQSVKTQIIRPGPFGALATQRVAARRDLNDNNNNDNSNNDNDNNNDNNKITITIMTIMTMTMTTQS